MARVIVHASLSSYHRVYRELLTRSIHLNGLLERTEGISSRLKVGYQENLDSSEMNTKQHNWKEEEELNQESTI